jgi:uncharacterized Zn-finger protein
MLRFTCQKCQYSFAKKSDLERHFARKTPCDKPKPINQLKIEPSTSYSQFEQDILNRPHVCDRCNSRFTQIGNLRRHQKDSWCAFADHDSISKSELQKMIKDHNLVPKSELQQIIKDQGLISKSELQTIIKEQELISKSELQQMIKDNIDISLATVLTKLNVVKKET